MYSRTNKNSYVEQTIESAIEQVKGGDSATKNNRRTKKNVK